LQIIKEKSKKSNHPAHTRASMGGVLGLAPEPLGHPDRALHGRATAPHRGFAIVRDLIGRQPRSTLLPPP
jgi:hypothetical protein